MRRCLAAAAVVLALAACSTHPDTGRVTSKRYEAAYTSYVPMCMSYNAKGLCQVWMPVPYTSGPFWVLELRDGESEWTVTTDPQRYERTNVGDTFTEQS